MSEHISITGNVEHWHTPQEIFAYCHRCKKENTKLTIEINQGLIGFSITARCSICKRAIWTAKIDDLDEQMTYWHTKKDKLCVVCGAPTNQRDCEAFGGKGKYWCSKKCYEQEE